MPMDEAALKEAVRALEKDLELSNVTDLRRDLLPIVEGLQVNPAVRYLILKHGRPQAVLMSFQTYGLLKKVMNLLGTTVAGTGREKAVDEAMDRLQGERSPAYADSAAATAKTA